MPTQDKGKSTRPPTLTQRVTRVEELVEKGLSLETAIKAVGITEEEARRALELPADIDLRSTAVMAALVKFAHGSRQRSNVMWHILTDSKTNGGLVRTRQELSEVTRTVNDHKTQLGSLESRFEELASMLGSTDLSEALKAAATGGEKSFIRVLRQTHSDDEIRDALSILKQDGDGELDLDNAAVFGEFFNEFVSFRASTQQDVDELKGDTTSLRKDVRQLEDGQRDIREKYQQQHETTTMEQETASWFTTLGLFLGAVAGIIVYFALRNHNWHAGPQTTSSTATSNGVKVTATNVQHHDIAFAHWYFDLIVAVLAGVAVLIIVQALGQLRNRTKTQTTSTTTVSSSAWSNTKTSASKGARKLRLSRKAKRTNEQSEQVHQNGANQQDGSASDNHDGAKTQVLPAVGAEVDHEPQRVG